jgi:hypothetical protein
MKRSHFLNSRVNTEYYEPLYKHLFDVIITPPDILTTSKEWTGGKELILDQITEISGIDVDLLPSTVKQQFKGATRNFSGVIPDKTSVEVTIKFNLNLNENKESFIYNAFRKWSDIQYDPLTATHALKSTYVSPAGLSVFMFDKIGDVYRKVELKNAFISKPFAAITKSYGNNELESMDISFIADYFNNTYKQ